MTATHDQVTETQVTEALRPVQDPELRRSIVSLGMVQNIAIAGGAVGVTIALTVPGCPLKAEIQRSVKRGRRPTRRRRFGDRRVPPS